MKSSRKDFICLLPAAAFFGSSGVLDVLRPALRSGSHPCLAFALG